MTFKWRLEELIGAGEAVAIARACGSTLGKHTFRRWMHNYLEQKGDYRLPCVAVGVAKVPMTTERVLREALERYGASEGTIQ